MAASLVSSLGLPCRGILALCVLALTVSTAHASQAYGSINNFDTVNDTSNVCHGFEIELEDLRSTDITSTYNWNHYGTPKITEDTTSVPGHTNVIIRYAAIRTNGVWSAYTAVPSGPIPPTQGHQFTNPGTNLSLSASLPNSLAIAWPTNFAGFLLQQNLDLTTTNWSSVSNAPSVVGTNQQILISPLTGRSFFRLAK